MLQMDKVNRQNIPYTYIAARFMGKNRERLNYSTIKNVIDTGDITIVIIKGKERLT